MSQERSFITWILRRECSHLNGYLVDLICKERIEIIRDHLTQFNVTRWLGSRHGESIELATAARSIEF